MKDDFEYLKLKIHLIYELYNGVEPRLQSGCFKKKPAYKKMEESNNREEIHSYLEYVRFYRTCPIK